MICLVYGPSASGKSAWAEARACELAGGTEDGSSRPGGANAAHGPGPANAPVQLAYLATMQRGGTEAQSRIERHLAQRAGKDFVTYEVPVLKTLRDAQTPGNATILLDDLGNLVANEMFSSDASAHAIAEKPERSMGPARSTTPGETAFGDTVERFERLAEDICATILELAGRSVNLVVVADAVGEAGWRGDALTRAWIEYCEAACCKLASAADEVVEVRSGIATYVKGADTNAARGLSNI